MKMIEDLYNSISLEDLIQEDNEDYTNSTDRVEEFLNKYISIEKKQEIELKDLISINRCMAQKQGFEIGFKYAMGLMKECFQ